MKRNTNKTTKDMYRYKLLIETIEKLERREYTGFDTYWCANTINWLWKWKNITKEEMESLCDRVVAVMK